MSTTAETRAPEARGRGGAAAVSRAFAGALLAGDAAAAGAYLAADVCLLSADGTEVTGCAAAGALLAQITAARQELEIHLGPCIVAGRLALCTQHWRRRSPAGSPSAWESASTARLVLADGPEGWKIAIASPWE